MDSPLDLAKQALAATGGKSTVKATEWILNRRAEFHHSSFLTPMQHPIHRSAMAGKGSILDCETIQRKGAHLCAGPVMADIEKPERAGLDREKSPNCLPVVDFGNSSPSERPVSTGSCSPLHRPSETEEEQFPMKILEPHRSSQSPEAEKRNMAVDLIAHIHLHGSGETQKTRSTKAIHPLSISQQATCKRQRQEQPEINRTHFLAPLIQQQGAFPSISVLSLAERMQFSSFDEILGQGHLLGPQLCPLLDAECLPRIIISGPPGTGKKSLARLLVAHRASCRIVALSCSENTETELQEALDDVKKAGKHGIYTIFFVEMLQKFNRSQQEDILSAIDAGHVGLIATALSNPSSELVTDLLSKCKILILKKLQADDLVKVMERAIMDKSRGILATLSAFPNVEGVAIEGSALRFLTLASNGDARLALDALEAAVILTVVKDKTSNRSECDDLGNAEIASSVTSGKEMNNFFAQRVVSEHSKVNPNVSKEGEGQKLDAGKGMIGKFCFNPDRETPVRMIVRVAEVKEALQCVVEQSGKGNQCLMAAMLKSMRGGDSNAAIYWLARVLENGENPLDVAQQLIMFASEEVGLADVDALVQAVSTYQACQLLGMPGCSLTLTQCVAYLSMAPKSAAVKDAILEVQKFLRCGGQEDYPVLVDMRTASDSKELDHLPSSLQGHVFLHWPESQRFGSQSAQRKRDQ